jgi:hypothetical protein
MNIKQNNTNNKFGRVLVVPSLCELYPDICLTTERKARKNLSQGSRRDSKNYNVHSLNLFATLTEVFPCFSLSCKANTRV